VQRDRRLLLILLAAAVVVAGVVIAIAVTRGSKSSSGPSASPSPAVRGAFLNGIPQRGLELGRADAPVTLVEFADLQCPYCAQFSTHTLPAVVRRYVRTGKVKLVFRGLHFLGPDSLIALGAAVAASFQNRLWNYVDALYARQGTENTGWVTPALLRDVAGSITHVDVDRLMRERTSKRALDIVRSDDLEGIRLGVNATPTFFVERPPATPQQLQLTALDTATFTAALDAALAP
jgi:protein-disulfide isomerase